MCNLYTELKDPLRADHRQFVLNDVTSLYNSTSIEDKANPESTFHKLLKKLLGRMSVDHASQEPSIEKVTSKSIDINRFYPVIEKI